jgi:hypothetical protein
MKTIDKSNGYVFGEKHEESNFSALMSSAVGADFEFFKYPLIMKYCVRDIIFCVILS